MMEEAPDQHARAMVSGIRLVHGRKASDRHGLFIGEGWAAVSGDSCPCAVDAERDSCPAAGTLAFNGCLNTKE